MQTHAKVLTLHAKILTEYWACHMTYQLKISSTNWVVNAQQGFAFIWYHWMPFDKTERRILNMDGLGQGNLKVR